MPSRQAPLPSSFSHQATSRASSACGATSFLNEHGVYGVARGLCFCSLEVWQRLGHGIATTSPTNCSGKWPLAEIRIVNIHASSVVYVCLYAHGAIILPPVWQGHGRGSDTRAARTCRRHIVQANAQFVRGSSARQVLPSV